MTLSSKPESIRSAHLAASNGYSPDRVVTDPALNRVFLAECRNRGLELPDHEINQALLNARKAGHFKGIRTTRKTSFNKEEDDYAFASEIAVRLMEKRQAVTLDRIICDPDLVQEFDRICEKISPGFTPLQYRWAALNLRKKRKLQPEILSRIISPKEVRTTLVRDIDVSSLSTGQGLYLFFDKSHALYVGETTNLRHRIGKHLDHSDNKGLARWIWESGTDDLHVEYHILPKDTSTRERRALEMELIRSRKPVFNVQT